jgi:hypothetical protein
MRFDTGEGFAYYTNSNAATCSFTLTASSRNILITKIDIINTVSSQATVTVQASGTTIWEMVTGSAGVNNNYDALWIDGAGAKTLSCLINASAGVSYIAVCGTYRNL